MGDPVLGGLVNHIKTVHEKVKCHKCDKCMKTFTGSGTLKTHIKVVHEGQRDHTCDFCGKSFGYAGSNKLINYAEDNYNIYLSFFTS